MALSLFDILIVALYLAVVIGNGWRASRQVTTLEDFAAGGRSYTTFAIFATLSAAFIGGGFTSGVAEKVFSFGLLYVVGLWGFSLKEIMVARFIAPRMGRFNAAYTVGDIMGTLYGLRAKLFTGIASFLVCAGILGAQFIAFGHITQVLLGINAKLGSFCGALVVMFYAGRGGMRAVVANDILHFCVLIIALPLVFIFGTHYIGGTQALVDQSLAHISTGLDGKMLTFVFLSFFFGETLVPPYVQRLLIGKDIKHTIRGNMLSGIVSVPFFLIVGLIGIIALTLDPYGSSQLALPSVVLAVMPVGLKGLAIAGMIAVIMSSADSFLNAASLAVTHDVLKPLFKEKVASREMFYARLLTYTVGLTGVAFTLTLESAIDMLLHSYMFWTPIILVPFVAGIMGIKRPPKVFWASVAAGMATVLIIKLSAFHNAYFEVSIWGVLANMAVFALYRPREDKVPFLKTIRPR